MNKVAPKISGTGSIKMPTKGGRNATTNAGMRGSGLAPKPSGGLNILGNDRPSAPVHTGLARVKSVPKGPKAGSFLPVQNNAKAGLKGKAFYGE